MKITRKITIVAVIVSILAFSAQAKAEDTLQVTLRDALYGGALGALAGAAILFLTKHPGDHLEYIPTGIGIGILGGAAYGLASNELVVRKAAGEVEGGKFSLNMPTINRVEVYDQLISKKEVINSLEFLRVKF